MGEQGKQDPFRVVITGGPCAGKTSLWRFMAQAFPQGIPVPEAATELILAGKSEDSLGLERFQRAVYERQQALEQEALNKGLLLLCDRGMLDGLAYFPGLLPLLGDSRERIMSRYDLVIHLAVIRDARAYAMHFNNNPARHEEHIRALEIEERIKGIYENHPAYAFLFGSLERKKQEARGLLRERLADLRPDLATTMAGQA
jgi:predicted ATPase